MGGRTGFRLSVASSHAGASSPLSMPTARKQEQKHKMFVEASLTMIRVLMPYHYAVVGFSFVEPNPRHLLSYFGIIELFKPNPSIMLAQN